MPQVTIIGGGPAGSAAAILLARKGWSVTLVEQHRFPREKVCGECLSALGIDMLRRHDLLQHLLPLDPVELHTAFLHDRFGQFIQVDLPNPMWGLSRATMDAALLDAAREVGTDIQQPARCEAIEPEVVVRNLQTNQRRVLPGDFVILADGKAAIIAARPVPSGDFGIRAHFTNLAAPRDAIQLFGVHEHYGGVAPIENQQFNVAFSVPARRMRPDLNGLFSEILDENPSLKSRFRRADRVSDWLASPLPRFAVANDWPDRVIPIGNAAAAIEPIGGEGMGLALRSAELAVDALTDPSSPYDPSALRRQFRSLWSTRGIFCRLAARLVASPALSSATFDLARANESLTQQIVQLIGKHSLPLAETPAARVQTSLRQTP